LFYERTKIFEKISRIGLLSDIAGINQQNKDGKLVPVEINATTIKLEGEKYGLCIVRDITARKKAEEELRESEERFHTLFEQASDAIVIFDAETGKLTQFNNRTCENLGYTRGEFRNLKLSDIEVIECPDSISKNMEKIKKEGRCTFETKQRTKDGRIQDILVNAKVVCIREKDYIQSIWIDITERKIMERQLITAAITDELTGLFNRRGFFTLAEQQCKLSDRTKRLMSLLYLDIDGLKTINDELGHREGDRALIDTANVLKRTFRESDIIARIGGDEFAVLLTEPSESDVENVVVNHLQNRLKEFNIQEDRNYELILSIGMSHYDPERPCSIDELFTRADDLMYYDKKHHKLLLNTETVLKIKEERREYKRCSVSNNYEAELDDSGRVKIKNISNGGICLKTSQRLDTGSIYKVKMFPTDNEVLATSGIIVWSSLTVKETDEKSILHQYELGLRFIEMKDSLKSSLEKLITQVLPAEH
ncbi:MAG: diguanylate cyclase, partial [Thermodesulfovibrionia bacterium]|nr:diguanylate cyclase [Thermodesulfovibrionia bacterium]